MKLHVVVPARNEEKNVPYFYERAKEALNALPDVDWNIVFVNNASEDGTLNEMFALTRSDPRVKIVTLSRDFGYHAALLAGLSIMDSDLYAIVDVDCEDPPELLPDFYRAISGSVQIAYGIRSQRDEPRAITLGRRMFYILNRAIADDAEIAMWMGEFSMFTRQVRDTILLPKTTFVSLRAEIGYVGFDRVGLPYQRARRKFGETHYNLWRMAVYAIASILSGTTFPLRLVFYLGAFIGCAFPLAAAALRLSAFDTGVMAAVVSLYYLVTALPLMSLYLARVYKNVVLRPRFVVDYSRTRL